MNDLRVGILGFGGAGMAHAVVYDRLPGCTVTRVFDPKPQAHRRAAEIVPKASVFDSMDGFLDELDVVSVCTPDDTHAEYIAAALARDVHVLTEKPLTCSVDGIRTIKTAESASAATVGVLHQMRFVPLFQKMKEAVDSGVLGALAFIEGYYVHDLTVRAFKYDDWRATSDATPMVYAGCHFVDLLRWLTGEEPHEAFAMAGHVAFPRYPESDLNAALLRFPSGAVGNVVVSIGTAGPQDHSVRIYGSEGSIDNSALFDAESKWVRTLHKPRLLHRDLLRSPWYLRARGILQQIGAHAPSRLIVECFETLRKIAPGPQAEYGPRHFPVRLYEHGLACLGAIRNFVQAVRGDEPVACTVDDSARTVLACLAGVESFRTNRPVPVKTLAEVL